MTQTTPEAAREAVERLKQWLSDHQEQEREDYEEGELAKLDGQGEFVLSDVEALFSERNTLAAENAALRQQLAEAREALEPFAEEYAPWCGSGFPDDERVYVDITIADLKRAASALATLKGAGHE